MKSKQNIFQNAVTVALVICAITVTGTLVYGEFFKHLPASTKHTRSGNISVSEWRSLLDGRTPAMGSRGSMVTIVEFSDYECPYCRELEPALAASVKKYKGKVVLYRYDFPLRRHSHAREAAIAAKCAYQQNAYEPLESELFRTELGNNDWSAMAGKYGMHDLDGFLACVENKETAALVDHDVAVGKEIGVIGTPTLIINGEIVAGALTPAELDRKILESMHENSGS